MTQIQSLLNRDEVVPIWIELFVTLVESTVTDDSDTEPAEQRRGRPKSKCVNIAYPNIEICLILKPTNTALSHPGEQTQNTQTYRQTDRHTTITRGAPQVNHIIVYPCLCREYRSEPETRSSQE